MNKKIKLLSLSTFLIASLMLAMCFFVVFLSDSVHADGFSVQIVDDSDHATTIGTINDVTDITLTQIKANADEQDGYTYEYYILDDTQPGQRGAKIEGNDPIAVSGDMFIIRVGTIQTFNLKIYKDTFNDEHPIELQFDYGENINTRVKNEETSGKLYLYYNRSGQKYENTDFSLTGDLDICRVEAYFVLVYDDGDPGVCIKSELVPQTATYNLAKYNTEAKYEYHYFYYDIANSEIKDEVIPQNTKLSENGYINYDYHIKFIQKKTLLEFTLSNNQNTDTKTVVYSEPYGTLFANPARAGYDFTGWFYKGDKITSTSIVNEKANHMLEAGFSPKHYTVKFDPQNGETIKNVEVTFNAPIEGITNPQKTGYVFLGWKYNSEVFDPTKPYNIPDNITVKANWVPLTFDVQYIIEDEVIKKTVSFDEENVNLSSPKLESLKENNIIFGLSYQDKDGIKLLTGSNLIVEKWHYLNGFDVEIVMMPKTVEYKSLLELPKTYTSDLHIYLDDEAIIDGIISKKIGYHKLSVKNSADEVVYEEKITIKEEFSFETEKEYNTPLYLSGIDAKVVVDGEEVDSADFRIDKNGTHTIVVLGADGYESTYVVTYSNPSYKRAWILFGIAMAIGVGVAILAIFGRRKVVKYDVNRE